MPAFSSARAGALTAWATAWCDGRVSIDEVVNAVTGSDAPHQVFNLPDVAGQAGLGEVLVRWRQADRGVHLVLPVPGDVRGMPGPIAFRDAALGSGAAVLGGWPDSTAGLAVVASVQVFEPSSAPASVGWHSFKTDPAPSDPLGVADAQYELATAIRETASALAAADVAGRADPGSLRDARRAGENLDLPRGFPQRAVALLAQAQRMQAVLDLAFADPFGGAVDRFGMSARESALRPLVIAVRRALVAGYNAQSVS